MADEAEFARLFADYQATYGNELRAKVARLDGLVGRSHWLSVGTYKENLLRSLLRNRLPSKYEVGTGFVLAQANNQRIISKQIDLLIWDSNSHSPFFRDGEFVIVAPEALAAAIEVKSTLDPGKLKNSLENLDSLMLFLDFIPRHQVVHRSVFAFDCSIGFPTTIFDGLSRHYRKFEGLPIQRRLQLSGDQDRWSLPWIDNIAVLDQGAVNCAKWSINGRDVVSYAAYSTVPGHDSIDAYGFLERSLFMDLMLGYQKYVARHTYPGFATALFANSARMLQQNGFIVLPDEAVTQVGRLTGEENGQWAARVYHPPQD
jgi:hypothetical protein